jgi:Mrp family chromosome partitioning ATPase
VAFRAGHVVMLARKDHTRVADTTNAIRELSDTGVRVAGTVINAF